MKKKGLYILSILQSMLLILTGCNDGNDWSTDGSAPSLHARFLTISTNSFCKFVICKCSTIGKYMYFSIR